MASVVYSPESVANYAIMLMLMCCRKFPYVLGRAKLQDYSLPGKRGRERSNMTVQACAAFERGEPYPFEVK